MSKASRSCKVTRGAQAPISRARWSAYSRWECARSAEGAQPRPPPVRRRFDWEAVEAELRVSLTSTPPISLRSISRSVGVDPREVQRVPRDLAAQLIERHRSLARGSACGLSRRRGRGHTSDHRSDLAPRRGARRGGAPRGRWIRAPHEITASRQEVRTSNASRVGPGLLSPCSTVTRG